MLDFMSFLLLVTCEQSIFGTKPNLEYCYEQARQLSEKIEFCDFNYLNPYSSDQYVLVFKCDEELYEKLIEEE